jgi:hypothetical protein
MGFRDVIRRFSLIGPEEVSGPVHITRTVPVPRDATPEQRADIMRTLLRQARDERGMGRPSDRQIEKLVRQSSKVRRDMRG